MDNNLKEVLLKATSSVMVMGPAGSGKVMMTKSILEENNIDFEFIDFDTLWRKNTEAFICRYL